MARRASNADTIADSIAAWLAEQALLHSEP